MLVPLPNHLLHAEDIKCGFFSDSQTLPLVISCHNETIDICEWFASNRHELIKLQHTYGALLFRGFGVDSAKLFEAFVTESSCVPFDTYLERQLKRDRVEGNVFTSTAHTKEGTIFLHNEQSFNLNFPRNIYFNSHKVAVKGGATPLADTRRIFQKIPEKLRNRLLKEGYLYQRNFMQNMYVDWPWAFQAESKLEAEEYFKANNILWEWKDDPLITLTTKQVRSVALIHPVTGDKCWFNHCTSFNLNSIEANARKFIQSSFAEHEYPYQTYFGDGESIDEQTVALLKKIYLEEQVTFQWDEGDVLMVDNLSVAHGREPFEGERLVLAAMSELCRWQDVILRP
ncbi:MAG: TauD/TfdA family dioxygenase [Colwellia sp.]|nr:TauD/TfdA family dioxygenase [Colwellia sp.]